MRNKKNYIGLFLIGLFTSCGQVSDDQSSNLLGLSNSQQAIWSDSDVSICFDERVSTSPNFDSLMASATADIQSAYTAEKTGVKFSGFGKCTSSSAVDAVIIFKSSFSAPLYGISASIGTFFSPSGMPDVDAAFSGRFGIQMQSSGEYNENIKWTLLHEIGHLVGLWHEHAHPESTCNLTQESALDKNSLPIEQRDHAYKGWNTAYDNKSIMNYCVGDALRDGYSKDSINSHVPTTASLSSCDEAVLKHIYSGAAIPETCTTGSDVQKPHNNPSFPSDPNFPNNPGFPNDPGFPQPLPIQPLYPSCSDIDYLSQTTGVCVDAIGQCFIYNYNYPQFGSNIHCQ